MHELSIAQSIVGLVEEQARFHGAAAVEEVELEIGRLAGLEPIALEFALESAVKGSLLEQARIVPRYIPGEGICTDCGATFPVDVGLSPCPACGSWWINITRGKELRIRSIVIEETEETS